MNLSRSPSINSLDVQKLDQTYQAALSLTQTFLTNTKVVLVQVTDFTYLIQRIEKVFELCEEQKVTMDGILRQVSSAYETLLSQVDETKTYYLNTMTSLQDVFFRLHRKHVHHSFLLDQDTYPTTLLDWVSVEEVSQMQREAYDELAEVQKLSVYLCRTNKHLTLKHTHITSFFEETKRVFLELLFQKRLVLENQEKAQEKCQFINSLLPKWTSNYNLLVRCKTSSSCLEDLVTCQETSRVFPEILPKSLDLLKIWKRDFEKLKELYRTLIPNVNQLVHALDLFVMECTKKSDHLDQAQTMWKEHCQGYEALFVQIKNLVYNYNKVLLEKHVS
eukprot:TRINITY_DN955_c0_g1_i24.p1 TRINITY_DN955_c0_g1~~TRINITY_DN955_c0_g1_i24.p1  ORF type:complete len:333 (+),score=47.58 TRINITY_DN955_c0_g1_i24:170-1168(+)